MIKGFFTQSAMILTDRPLELDAVEKALEKFDVGQRAGQWEKNWISGYPSWTIRCARKCGRK